MYQSGFPAHKARASLKRNHSPDGFEWGYDFPRTKRGPH